MQKILSLIIICITVVFCGVAQNEVALLDSIIGYEFTSDSDSLVEYRWLYQYNNDGQLLNYEWLQRYYSDWKIIATQQNTYDNFGNLIIQNDNVPRGDWLRYPYVKQEWEYDHHENPLIRTRHYKFV